jgi:uncharacterized membrane protein YdcZ (DUF606 family)
MNRRRGAGVFFCFIAAFLLFIRYTSAAIYSSGVATWNEQTFNAMLGYTGNTLVLLSFVSLGVGIIYLIMAEKTAKTD